MAEALIVLDIYDQHRDLCVAGRTGCHQFTTGFGSCGVCEADPVGEFSEATNESLCEDIMPPMAKDASKCWEGLRWVCPLQAVSLLSKVGTVAIGSVAGRSKSPSLLIQLKEYRSSNLFQIVRKYCEHVRFCPILRPRCGMENVAGAARNVRSASAFRVVLRAFSCQQRILNRRHEVSVLERAE